MNIGATEPQAGGASSLLTYTQQDELARAQRHEAELQQRVSELENAGSLLETYAADLSRTYGELRRQVQHMTVLLEMNTRIAAVLHPDDVVKEILDSFGQLVSCDRAAVFLVDHESTEGEAPKNALGARLRGEQTAAGTTLNLPATYAPDDSPVAVAIRHQRRDSRDRSQGLQIAVPLRAGGRTLGAIEIERRAALTPEELTLLELLAAAIGVALYNAELYEETQRLATIDPLTGLGNRRHFYTTLDREVERARRMGYPVGVLMMDLDHFKVVNDRYGHPVGDRVLQAVAGVLQERLRRTDVLGRLGGEEFGAILPGASREEVALVAEKIRGAVEELRPLRDLEEVGAAPTTISVGGVSLTSEELTAENLMGWADQSLYVAKGKGRNRVEIFPAPERGSVTDHA